MGHGLEKGEAMTTTEILCALLHERHAKGLEKYKKTLDRDDYTPEQWLQHVIEELLDGAGYLIRLKDEIGKMREKIERLRDLGDQLFEELDDKTPKTDCQCAAMGFSCANCVVRNRSLAVLKEWKEETK